MSRAVADKYALLPDRTIVPLSDFFGVSGGVDGELRRLLESADGPISDQRLADRLREAGYPIARRTVAKHRARLGSHRGVDALSAARPPDSRSDPDGPFLAVIRAYAATGPPLEVPCTIRFDPIPAVGDSTRALAALHRLLRRTASSRRCHGAPSWRADCSM